MASPYDSKWHTAVRHPALQAALAKNTEGTLPMSSSLRAIADDTDVDADVRHLSRLLSAIACFMPNSRDWTNPYGPFAVLGNRRSPVPTDLSKVDADVLSEVAEHIPNLILRSRVFDVAAIIGEPVLKPALHEAQLKALVDHGVTSEAMTYEAEQWGRGFAVGVRLPGVATAQLEEMERQFVEAATAAPDGPLAVQAARMLASYSLGEEHAGSIAKHLVELADDIEPVAAQETLKLAAKWYSRAGDSKAAEEATFGVVKSLIAEADASEALIASANLEMALKTLRTLPRVARERLGAADLDIQLARRIRDRGAAAIGEMRVSTSEVLDLSDSADELLDMICSDDPSESVRRFTDIQPFASLSGARMGAERHRLNFPFLHLVENRRLSPDGRTTYRSSMDEEVRIYGENASTWERIIDHYQMRVSLLGGVVLPRAWRQVSTAHRLHLDDFQILAEGSPIVPSGHEEVFARGLYYGYTGDFGAAVHLLVPAIEALVRLHLANAGTRTSTIGRSGNEHEVGLSALMENEEVIGIFGEDVAFELRALLCGPIGPNLRNEIAHGLIGDAVFFSASSVYLWWFTLKLIFMPYWNVLHDAEAARAREPGVPESEATESRQGSNE